MSTRRTGPRSANRIVLLLACTLLQLMPSVTVRNCCGPGCREPSVLNAFYDKKYFAWQMKQGLKKARSSNFSKILKIQSDTHTVLDFGAGTGAILSSIRAAKRIAVEFNPSARRYMAEVHPDLVTYQYPEQVPNRSVDIVYSTSVIEHVECPSQELRELRLKLKEGGKIVIGIKNEGVELWRGWQPDNKDNHLYTWNSMLLGNLLRGAGFYVDWISSCDDDKTARTRVEHFVATSRFGAKGHTFQYIWAYGHVPTAADVIPQITPACTRISSTAARARAKTTLGRRVPPRSAHLHPKVLREHAAQGSL